MTAGVNTVTCATEDDFREKPAAPVPEAVGNFRAVGDSFPRQVLVVDDELLIRWSISETLSDIGYAVAQASDAGEALRAVTTADRPFEVVVLDLRLPDMCDLSLLRTLRRLLPNAALILMTAFGTTEIISQARALGATVLNKPFELAELERVLSEPATDKH